jgi:Zn-finger nucleic acid-binding protein
MLTSDHLRKSESTRCPVCGQAASKQETRCQACGAALTAGGYRVLRALAQNDFSRVYLAEDSRLNRVALKELLFARVPDSQQLDAFERESAILATLSHPRIPRFIGSFREGDGPQTRFYLAQQFIGGRSYLQRLNEAGCVDEPHARQLLRRVLGILRYLHGRRPAVLHRDIKPANLIETTDGEVFLVDFGSARHLRDEATHRATLVGTVGYMPIEQLGGSVGPFSDLYALGSSVVHLLTGRRPSEFLDADYRLRFEGHVEVTPPFLAFLKRLAAPSAKDRFPSALDAERALEESQARPGESRGVRCADCGATMRFVNLKRSTAHRCSACGSTWLLREEMERLLGRTVPFTKLDKEPERRCCVCREPLAVMLASNLVVVEWCRSCRGVFLDRGELHLISSVYGGARGRAGTPVDMKIECPFCVTWFPIADGRPTSQGLVCPECIASGVAALPGEQEPQAEPAHRDSSLIKTLLWFIGWIP